jgi:uncharacterized protein
MRVGITGSAGLIGTATAEALTGRGDTVVRFTRHGDSAPGSTIRWDPDRGEIDRDALRRVGGLDAIVHLAGAGIGARRWTRQRRSEIWNSRIASTTLLVRALSELESDVATLVSASAIGYYGSRGDEELDESSTAGHDFLARLCTEWEAAAELAEPRSRVVRLRTGIIQSTSGGALAKQIPLFRIGAGAVLGSGRQWMSPVTLRDAVRAILFVIDQPVSGPVNVVAPQAVRNRDYCAALASALNRPARLRVPGIALRTALGSDFASLLILTSQRVVPRALLDAGFEFESRSIDEILRSALNGA